MDINKLGELIELGAKRQRQLQQQKAWYELNKEKMLEYHKKRNAEKSKKLKELKTIELVREQPDLHEAIIQIINEHKNAVKDAKDV